MQQALDDVNLPLLTFLMAAGGVGASRCYPHESMVKISAELLAQLLDAGIVNVNARDPTHGTFALHRVRARLQISLLLRKMAVWEVWQHRHSMRKAEACLVILCMEPNKACRPSLRMAPQCCTRCVHRPRYLYAGDEGLRCVGVQARHEKKQPMHA